MRTVRGPRSTLLCSLLACGLVGCGGGADVGTKPGGATTAKPGGPGKSGHESRGDGNEPDTPAGVAVLEGRVSFTGTPIPDRTIDVTKDPEVCGPAAGAVPQAVVSTDGGLAGVVVEIQGIDEPDGGFDWPEAEYVLTQKGCRFSPGLLVIPKGAEVRVLNEDTVTHNVNTGEWNVLQAEGEAPIERAIDARLPTRVSCNIHSWMEAWVYPARSPFHAVTDADGRYRIEGVPAGTYRVDFWHPAVGRERGEAELVVGGTAEQNATFESPVRD